MFEKLLLAVDGSEHALHATRKAAEIARRMGSRELCLVIAYEMIPPYLGEPNLQFAINNRKNYAEEICASAIKEIGDVPCEIHAEVVEGDPAEVIIGLANSRKSDLIVMGSRGLGRLAGLVLGSASQKVVSHAPCPVLIVR
ncbi:MAG: universal stress protein [Anaerolineales bacterium]|nr:universal stress protein [Anaerolineales bacterium]